MEPGILHVRPWTDPVVEDRGFDLRSEYVERFWLPVLGPSTTLLLRRLATELERAPGGVDLDPESIARGLGLGHNTGPRAPLRRALGRCVRFGAARPVGDGGLAVRRALAPLPLRHLAMLPVGLQEEHRMFCPALPITAGAPAPPA